MKKLFALLVFAGFATIGYGQNMYTTSLMAHVPNIPDEEETTLVAEEVNLQQLHKDIDIELDKLFQKMVLIESTLYSNKEWTEHNEEHICASDPVTYF